MSKRMIALLAAEHLVALDMVKKLNQDLEALKRSQNLDLAREGLWDFSRFLEHKLQGHLPQEEETLFPKLVSNNPGFQAHVDAMLDEHRQLLQAHTSLKQVLQDGNTKAVIDRGEELCRVLEQHLQHEHQALSHLK